jgi:serine protease AprX
MREQVPRETVDSLADEPDGREKIVARLRATAQRRSGRLDARLGEWSKSAAVRNVRPLWLVNAVAVEASPAFVARLASDASVARLRLVARGEPFAGLRSRSGGLVLPPERRDRGTELTGAFRVHEEIGIAGDGVIVAVVDSGVCWRHPGIAGRVWVNPGEDLDGDGVVMDADDLVGDDGDGNGFVDDLIGWDFDEADNDPDDGWSGHGSHVAGTVAGDGGGGFAAGTAPGASIMIVRVGQFSGDEVDAWRGIEYAVANGADVINLSMGWPHRWRPARAMWRRLIDSVVAMGIPFVAAAGNEGWEAPPDSVRTPADVPSAIAVGSTAMDDTLSEESSIGPVTWEDVPEYGDFPLPEGALKPELVAPGVDTRSHSLCEGTALDTGTSMAAPHVSGAIALLLEADPALTPDDLERLLMETAVDLGEPGADASFGAGRLDAWGAVSRANGGLRADGARVEDLATGNGNGAIDPGETARVVVSVRNDGDVPAGPGVTATAISETPGLEVIEGDGVWGVIPAGESADPLTPGFLVRSDLGCAERATLRIELRRPDGARSLTRVTLRSGRPEAARLLRETFESESGWTAGGDAIDGMWERAAPEGARLGREWTSPPRDTADRGRRALLTGAGADGPRAGDVDGGETWIVSPAIDASRYESLVLSYARWYYREELAGGVAGSASARDEALVVELSDDDGRSWIPVDVVERGSGGWTRATRPLDPYVTLTPRMRIRARVADPQGGVDGIVEAGIDDLRLFGRRLRCDPVP